MTREYEAIPADAWKGVGNPTAEDAMPCPSCGNPNTHAIGMAEMMTREIVCNANTFLIPGRSFGYLVCDRCEDAQRRAVAPRRPWWRFWS
jgi:NMD protein affecting ribosome stability and mRNA decay